MTRKLKRKRCPLDWSMSLKLLMQNGLDDMCNSHGTPFKLSIVGTVVAVQSFKQTGCRCFLSVYPNLCCLFIRSKRYEGFRSWHSCIKSKSTYFCLSDRKSCTEPTIALHHAAVPFDFYCSSIQGKLNEGIFPKCSRYWPSKASLGRPMPCHNERKSAFEQEESDSEIEDSEKCTDEDELMPAFGNIFEIFKLLFVKLE